MKKLILTIALMVSSFALNAQQGVVTVDNGKSDVPLEQWYVVRDKLYNNMEFFYGDKELVFEELKTILRKDDQTIDFPKGTDEGGDKYWIIMYENEQIAYIYLSEFKSDENLGLITVVIK
jgi:hypothetical protein